MKAKLIIILIIIAAIVTWYFATQANTSSEPLEVDCFFAACVLPLYTPLSNGILPGASGNPAFPSLTSSRHLVMIVSIPAWKIFEMAEADQYQDPDGDNPYCPEFTLTLEGGRQYPSRLVKPWPKTRNAHDAQNFHSPDTWYPKPGDKMNKRFIYAIDWIMSRKESNGPFQLQMNNDPPINVPADKYSIDYKWPEI